MPKVNNVTFETRYFILCIYSIQLYFSEQDTCTQFMHIKLDRLTCVPFAGHLSIVNFDPYKTRNTKKCVLPY